MRLQLDELAAWQTTVTHGRLVPVSETFIAPQRSPGADNQRFGWAGRSTLLSPAGDYFVVRDPTADFEGMQVVHLPQNEDASLQLATANETAGRPATAGFSGSGELLGIVFLDDDAIVSQIYTVRAASWQQPTGHLRVGGQAAVCRTVSFSSDESLAAVILQHVAAPISVLVFSTDDSSYAELIPLLQDPAFTAARPVSLLWVPGKHMLLVVTSCGLLAADVGALALAGQSPDILRFKAVMFPEASEIVGTDRAAITACVQFEPGTSALQLFLTCKDQPVQQPQEAVVCALLIDEICPQSQAPGQIVHMLPIEQSCENVIQVRQGRFTTAVWFGLGVLGFVRDSSGELTSWQVPRLRQPVWSPGHLAGYFLAGLQGTTVVVLDAYGKIVATWQPVRRQGASPSGLPVLILGWL